VKFEGLSNPVTPASSIPLNFFFFLTADPIAPATRLSLTGNPSISTRNSFLLLGLSFFYTSSQTGGTATRVFYAGSFRATAASQLLANFLNLGVPSLGGWQSHQGPIP
jgi:hypothetical protein